MKDGAGGAGGESNDIDNESSRDLNLSSVQKMPDIVSTVLFILHRYYLFTYEETEAHIL